MSAMPNGQGDFVDRLKSWARKMMMLALVSVLLLGLAYSFPADLALLMAIDLSVYDLKHLTAIISQLRAQKSVAKIERVNG